MADRATYALTGLRRQLGWSPTITALGGIGIGLAATCVLAALLRGAEVPPEGNLLETASFDGAVGFFVLTLVVLASAVRWTSGGKRRWVGALAFFLVYSYTIETVQAFRGLDPRFSSVAGPADRALGGLFLLVALGVMVSFLVVAWKYARAEPTPLVVAVRYGAIASLVAFGVGIWMSLVTQGRYVGTAGNLLFLHAAGFHGLQAVPLVALMLGWANVPDGVARHRVHAAGLAWLGACLAIAWQSGSGRSIADATPALGAAVATMAVWAVLFVMASAAWLTAASWPVVGLPSERAGR